MNPPDRSLTPASDEDATLSFALRWDDSLSAAPAERSHALLLEESIAAACLTAPRHRAPGRCLTEIKMRTTPAPSTATMLNGHNAAHAATGNGGTGGTALPAPEVSQKLLIRIGWGLAAALAVLTGWQSVRVVSLQSELTAVRTKNDPKNKGQMESASTSGDVRGAAGHSESRDSRDAFAPSAQGSKFKIRNMTVESILVPDRPALMRQLDELQRVNDARFQPSPGLARTVVMELQPPGSATASPVRTRPLSDEVAGIIAAGMNKERPASDRTPFSISGGDKSRSADEIVITDGLPNLSGFPLQEDTTLYHKNFPADAWQQWEGLHLLKDGSFYDDLNNILWKPVPGEGRRYSGRTPTEPILLDEQAAPPGAAAPPQPSAPSTPAPPEPQPLIWSIYDESRGEGRLVVSDLPPPPQGQAYQLWFEDPRSSTPITAGLLPPLEQGGGQVWFNLTPGVSPTRYRLTLEPAAGSAQPLGPTILTGP